MKPLRTSSVARKSSPGGLSIEGVGALTDEQRQRILERDGYRCQLNKCFGIEDLTGVPCDDRLEVHHLRYPEKDDSDLITVCLRCHDIITDAVRREREKKPFDPQERSESRLLEFGREIKTLTAQDSRENIIREVIGYGKKEFKI